MIKKLLQILLLYLCSIKNSSDVPMPSFCLLKIVLHVCVGLMGCNKGGRFKIQRGGVAPASCQMWQLTCSMGPEWTEIRTCASRATTLSKGSLHLKTHIFKTPYCILYNIVLILYICLLCRLQRNSMKSYEFAFILGPVSMVANNILVVLQFLL
jgi:hypothetical protein